MDSLFFLLFLLSLFSLIVGMVKPSAFNKVFKKELNRKSILKIFGGCIIVSLFAIGTFASDEEKTTRQTNNVTKKVSINKSDNIDDNIKKEDSNNKEIENKEKEKVEIDNDVENNGRYPECRTLKFS